jgi:hypothetical protein
MSGIGSLRSSNVFRTKAFVFGFIAIMALYVLYHFERFLIDWNSRSGSTTKRSACFC